MSFQPDELQEILSIYKAESEEHQVATRGFAELVGEVPEGESGA